MSCSEGLREPYDSRARIKARQRDRRRTGPSLAMSSSASILLNRLVPTEAISRRERVASCLTAILHLVALIMMAATEADLVAKAAFLLVWALLNFFWLGLFRRPVVAALISIEFVVALTLLSPSPPRWIDS